MLRWNRGRDTVTLSPSFEKRIWNLQSVCGYSALRGMATAAPNVYEADFLSLDLWMKIPRVRKHCSPVCKADVGGGGKRSEGLKGASLIPFSRGNLGSEAAVTGASSEKRRLGLSYRSFSQILL